MKPSGAAGIRAALIWAALACAIVVPLGLAATSPLLAWRDPIYIAAGFAGIAAMAVVLVQPLLAGGVLPGLGGPHGRRVHRSFGTVLVAMVVVHVGGLWITSPPDVIDALLFASPTPFSDWGVIAMWAVFAAALLAVARRPLRVRPRVWRIAHTACAAVVVVGSIVHALLIERTMEPVTKGILCALVAAALASVFLDLRVWQMGRRSG